MIRVMSNRGAIELTREIRHLKQKNILLEQMIIKAWIFINSIKSTYIPHFELDCIIRDCKEIEYNNRQLSQLQTILERGTYNV